MQFNDTDSERFDIGPTDKRGIAAFKEYLWHNSECCNYCFTRVRAVGDLRHVEKDIHVHEVNEFYERTDWGEQAHHPFTVSADRYGQCFCLDCGGDTSADNDDLDFETFKEFARNVYLYTKIHTPLELNQRRFAQEAVELKKRPDTQGRDRRIFAVAFARALKAPPAQATADTSRRTA